MFTNIALVLFLLASALAKEQVLDVPHVDHVLHSLSAQQWDEDELTCKNKIVNVLENVKNSTLWATWVWDSNPQASTGIFFGARMHLGNYDQCLSPPWLASNPELRTQYCLADIEMSKTETKTLDVPGPYAQAEEYYLELGTRFGRSFSYMAYGVCLPAGCPTKSVEKFVRALLNTGYLRAAKDAEVTINHCEEAGVKIAPSRGFYIYWYTIAALLFTAVASTYYISELPVTANRDSLGPLEAEMTIDYDKINLTYQHNKLTRNGINCVSLRRYFTPENYTLNHVAKSFCLHRNWATVFKEDKDALPSMHGIRFLTAVIIIFIHQCIVQPGTSVSNALHFDQVTDNTFKALLLIHGDVYTDTFFAMSALLLGKSLRTLDVTKPYNLVKNILKRYIRLMVQFAVSVFYLAHVSMHSDNGPVYPKIAKFEQQACEKNWWLALLMVGNYFNTSEMCHPATWYIPCAFHYYLITLILLYVYRKNPGAGKIGAAIVLAIGVLGPIISAYVYDLPAVLAFKAGLDINIRRSKSFNYGYIRTHNRMGPYIVGLLVGYAMSVYKPTEHKKIWSKTTSFLGAQASLALMGAVLGAGYLCYMNNVHGFLACIFMVFNRATFSVAVLGVIVFCTYGDVPLINSFLSWKAFAPVSRLSYGVYLAHMVILYRSKVSLRSHFTFHIFDSIIESGGLAATSLVLSLIVWLLVEAPLINFTNRYLDTKSQTEKVASENNGVARNGAVASNGVDKHKST